MLGSEWKITEAGENLLTNNGSIKDKNTIQKNALNTDIKEYGAPTLESQLKNGKVSNTVLQIQKIRNISAPKANENSQAAPRMLKLILTDGSTIVQAIEISHVGALSLDKTPPGSKVLITEGNILNGYLLINASNCKYLGGQVESLMEKWTLSKSLYNNKRQSSTDGPPAWVNFGCKIQASISDKNFKSIDEKTKETSEFDLQRKDAIAEVTSGAVKKVFGGGTKQPAYESKAGSSKTGPNKSDNERGRNRGRNLKGSKNEEKDVEERPLKPSEKVSLFSFLEDKLPVQEPVQSIAQNSTKNNYSKDNNPTSKYEPQGKQNYNNPKQFNQPNKQANYQNPPRKNNYQQNGRNNFYSQESYNQGQQFNQGHQSSSSYQKNEKFSGSYNKSYEQPTNFKLNSNQNKYQNNADVNHVANDLTKMQINNQFASRSLRQHLNLTSNSNVGAAKFNDRTPSRTNDETLNVGQECLAKYWEDGKFYNALITAVTDKTYVVQFKGYNNIEEILKKDCKPAGTNSGKNTDFCSNNTQHSGTMEFRRSGSHRSNSYYKQ